MSARATFPSRPGLTLWFGVALALHVVDSAWRGVHADRAWWQLLLAMAASYFLCICVHDAVHGAISHKYKCELAAARGRIRFRVPQNFPKFCIVVML